MVIIAAFYCFTPFPHPAALKPPLEAMARAHGICGTILLAVEGINGTVAGSREAVDTLLAHIRGMSGCADISHKESRADKAPFQRLKVRLKREIVSMGQPHVDPAALTGTRVEAKDWNALIAAPDVAIIDTRNGYETALGSFPGAVMPQTASFRDFPAWWQANATRFAGKRIAMFCTGGIRCEKATNYLLGEGVEDVSHLNGGILRYLEQVAAPQSQWQGQCYVYDARVSVGTDLRPGDFSTCHACRRPLSPEDRIGPHYEEGVTCHHCVAEHDEIDRGRFRERQRQLCLAASRGKSHRKTA